MGETGATASPNRPESELNEEFWSTADVVAKYARDDLRPVEALLFDRHRRALAGRVLEIGCGGGRITRHLCRLSTEVHALDISQAMASHTSRVCPEAIVSQADMRDLSAYESESFDALVASFNCIDALDHEDRQRALAGFGRVLVPGGLLIFSSHNRAFVPAVRGPGGRLLAELRRRRLRNAASLIRHLPRQVANRRRLRRLERREDDYAIVNDSAHDYAMLHYYISRDVQASQLEEHGFELLQCLDLHGRTVAEGEDAPESSELHYVARRVGDAGRAQGSSAMSRGADPVVRPDAAGPRLSRHRAMRWSPAQLAFRRRAAGRLTVLAYHGVDDRDTFGLQLDHLARNWRPVTLETVVDAVAGRRELPPRAVLITFDDGQRSVLEAGLPLLRKRGLPAVVFVVAGVIDTDEPLWWTEVEGLLQRGGRTRRYGELGPAALVAKLKAVPDGERLEVIAELRATARAPAPRIPQLRADELEAMEAAGIAVGNHTLTHPCLPNCDDTKVTGEILESHERLRALGRNPRAFAYPNGAWDARAERALRGAGYEVSFVFDHRSSPRMPPHPMRISRLRVRSDTSLDRFAVVLSGLQPALHRARHRG